MRGKLRLSEHAARDNRSEWNEPGVRPLRSAEQATSTDSTRERSRLINERQIEHLGVQKRKEAPERR